MVKEFLESVATAMRACKALPEKRAAYEAKKVKPKEESDYKHWLKCKRSACRLCRLTEEYRIAAKAIAEATDRFLEIIEGLPPIEAFVLIERYGMLKTWDEIADEINYSRAQVFRIHNRAIQWIEARNTTEELKPVKIEAFINNDVAACPIGLHETDQLTDKMR